MHYSFDGLEAVRQLDIHHSRTRKKKRQKGKGYKRKQKENGAFLQTQRTACHDDVWRLVWVVYRELTPSDMQSGCQEKRPANKQMNTWRLEQKKQMITICIFPFFFFLPS